MVVGAPWAEVDGVSAVGEAHLFDVSTGALLQTFQNPNSSPGGDQFGSAMAVSEAHSVGEAHHFNATTEVSCVPLLIPNRF